LVKSMIECEHCHEMFTNGPDPAPIVYQNARLISNIALAIATSASEPALSAVA
jgi:hypothetical protein